jgi:hypothetical protein
MAGRLLLKYDGCLAEAWNPLDPEPPYQPPDRWNGPHVQIRFAEAIGAVSRLPGRVWPRGYFTLWPQFESEWADMLSRLSDGGDAHEQWVREQNAPRREPPTSIEIMRMETCLCWPGAYLRDEPERARALNVVGLATSREVSVEDVAGRGRHRGVKSATVWHELAQQAAHAIAVGLRIDRVAVF